MLEECDLGLGKCVETWGQESEIAKCANGDCVVYTDDSMGDTGWGGGGDEDSVEVGWVLRHTSAQR